jgi:homoserine acetyltransferase
MPTPADYELFELEDLPLQHGQILRGAKLTYKTYGPLDADKSNVVLHPTGFRATGPHAPRPPVFPAAAPARRHARRAVPR